MDEQLKLGELVELRTASRLEIRDYWNGYSPDAPIDGVYDLHRDERGVFAGEGRLSVSELSTDAVKVSLPAERMTRFLDAIAGTTIIKGAYEPRFEWTDDYPTIEITMHLSKSSDRPRSRTVRIFTSSQGKLHTPWGARIMRQNWTLPGVDLGRAILALCDQLRRAIHDPRA